MKEEYYLLMRYLKKKRTGFRNRLATLSMGRELRKAELVDRADFPADVVRLNSTVIVKDVDTNRVTTYTLVLPEKADHRQAMISILSPIGIALIGFRKGLQFTWNHFSAKHKLSILEVYNSSSLNHSPSLDLSPPINLSAS